jgi:heme oxygenase
MTVQTCRIRSDFHVRLQYETRAFHSRLESRLRLLDPHLTVDEYRALLRQFYGFYKPLEAVIGQVAIGSLGCEAARRRKLQWLVQDLLGLGDTERTIAGLPLCMKLPPLMTQARVMGSLYVVEGATLGGQIVARFLRQSLGDEARRCCRFFVSYGEQVRPMWAAFLEALALIADGPEQEQDIIASACDTFQCFERWLAHA